MVDVNYTIIVQLANFLFLLVVLNILLIKPVLRHLSERDAKVSSSHEEAKANADKAEEMLAQFERELAETRVKAGQAYNAVRQEGVAQQRTTLAAAKGQAQEMVEKAKAEIASDASRAREILKSQMEKLPREIASKLLGRAV